MILKYLKEATGARHIALESRLPLLDAGMSRLDYLQLLRRFSGYYEPLEAQLLALPYWRSMDFDYVERYKTPRLKQDLQALGETPRTLEQVDRCSHLPALASLEQLLGCLYVIEGATLGGQVITRRLQANLGLAPASGAAFFSGYGAQTGSRWKAFCAMLNANAGEAKSQADIVGSANLTFETLGKWLFPDIPQIALPASRTS